MGKRLEEPAVRAGRRYQYRDRFGVTGVGLVVEVYRKRNGWYISLHDRAKNRVRELRRTEVFELVKSGPDCLIQPPRRR